MVRVVRAGADHRNETQRILGSQVERHRLAPRRGKCLSNHSAFQWRLSLRRYEAKAQSPGRQASGFRAKGFGQSAELPTAREGRWVPSRARLDFSFQDRLTVGTTERKAGIPEASGSGWYTTDPALRSTPHRSYNTLAVAAGVSVKVISDQLPFWTPLTAVLPHLSRTFPPLLRPLAERLWRCLPTARAPPTPFGQRVFLSNRSFVETLLPGEESGGRSQRRWRVL